MKHPNLTKEWSKWAEIQKLHIVLPYSNPCRWKSRRELFNNTYHHLLNCPNLEVYVGEIAYGDYPFEVTSLKNKNHLQLRCESTPLFHKENIINIVVSKLFPKNYQYGAYIDSDLITTRHDWALETIHLLKRFPWVQIFSSFAPLSQNNIASDVYQSFAYRYLKNKQDLEGAPGGGWAWTQNAFDTSKGLFDVDIVGGGDSYMAFGLVAAWSENIVNVQDHVATKGLNPNFLFEVLAWQTRCRPFWGHIGCIDHFIVHQFHGSYKERGYNKRHDILRNNNFDPKTDLIYDKYGMIELKPEKIKLNNQIKEYLFSRNEDSGFISTKNLGY